MSALPVDRPEEVLEPQLLEGLKRLKLRRMRHLAPQVCLTARTQRWRPEELLRVLVEEECMPRDKSNRLARHRQAGFPVIKELATFDLGATNLNRATFDYLTSAMPHWWARRAQARPISPSRWLVQPLMPATV